MIPVVTAVEPIIGNLSATQQAQAQEKLGVDALYLIAAHGPLQFGLARDGVTFHRVGSPVSYQPPDGASENPRGLRDPAILYYPPTKEWIIAYTHTKTGGSGYATTCGLCKTKDFKTVDYIGEIPFAGTGITINIAWAGRWFVEDGRYYFTVLPMDAGGSRQAPGVGWVECTNPGTWTTWTSFTAFRATNSNFSASRELNGVHIVKVGATYHLFCDGDVTEGGTFGLLHATSASPFTGYSALALVSSGADYEGAYFVPLQDGSYRLYCQPVFGPMSCMDSDDLITWSAPAEINWPGYEALGNGSVVPMLTLEEQESAVSASTVNLFLKQNGAYVVRVPGVRNERYVKATLTGNADLTTDVQASAEEWVSGPRVDFEQNGYFKSPSYGFAGGVHSGTTFSFVSAVGDEYNTLRSGNASKFAAIQIGRTGNDGFLAVAGATDQFITGTVAGSILLRAEASLLLGTAGNAIKITTTACNLPVVNLKAYTVATLPAGVQGDMAYVSDATAPTYLGALTGGGAVVVPVFRNATVWVSH